MRAQRAINMVGNRMNETTSARAGSTEKRSLRSAGDDFAVALVCAAVCAFFILNAGGIGTKVGGADLFGYFVPKYEAVIRALFVEHRLPQWNPYEYSGAPLLGAHQPTTFYPLTWITFGLFPSLEALQLFYILHFFVLAWGMLAYFRRHGVSRVAGVAGVMVALAAVFTGQAKGGVDHPSFLAALAWFPAILLFWEKSVTSPRPWLAWMAVAVAAQWLAGYPDFSLSTPVVMAVLAVVGNSEPDRVGRAAADSTPTGPGVVRRLALLVAGFALGAALAAIQLVPTTEAIAETARLDGNLGLWRLRNHFLIDSLTDLPLWTSERVGIAAVLLALAVLIRPSRARAAWLAGLGLTIFIGFPPLRWLYYLPVYSGIRFPFAWDLLGGVMWGILVGVGLSTCLRSAVPVVRWAGGAIAIWALLLSSHIIWEAPVSQDYDPPDPILHAERARYLESYAAAYGGRVNARIFSPDDAAAGTPIRYGLYFAAGYEPAVPPARIATLLEKFYYHPHGSSHQVPIYWNPRLAQLIGVGLAVSSGRTTTRLKRVGYRQIGLLPGGDVVLYKHPVPRARLVYEPIYAPSPVTALGLTTAPERDLVLTAVVEGKMPDGFEPYHVTVPDGRAIILESKPERVVVEVRQPRDGLLVLTDTYSPSWVATVDGRPAPLLRADYAFRGVAVPEGVHTVVFQFESMAVPIGAAITLVAAIGALVLIWGGRRATAG